MCAYGGGRGNRSVCLKFCKDFRFLWIVDDCCAADWIAARPGRRFCGEIGRSIEKIGLIDHRAKRRATNSRDVDNDVDKFNSLQATTMMVIIVSS